MLVPIFVLIYELILKTGAMRKVHHIHFLVVYAPLQPVIQWYFPFYFIKLHALPHIEEKQNLISILSF